MAKNAKAPEKKAARAPVPVETSVERAARMGAEAHAAFLATLPPKTTTTRAAIDAHADAVRPAWLLRDPLALRAWSEAFAKHKATLPHEDNESPSAARNAAAAKTKHR